MMTEIIEFGGMTAEVRRKKIKHVHLSVCPPSGAVHISAPSRLELETLRLFAASKLGWIRRQQRKFYEQERETPREYLERESHYVWGRRCLLRIAEKDAPPSVLWNFNTLTITVRPDATAAKKHETLARWYRAEVLREAARLAEKWHPIIGVGAARLSVRKMKTRWGSCNTRTGDILFNTDLAKKLPACLEYVVVHEMTHLLERTHNARFMRLMDGFLPQWRQIRDTLNRAPLSAAKWDRTPH